MSDCRSCGCDPCSCGCAKCGQDPCGCGPCLGCGGIPCSCGRHACFSDPVNLNPNGCTVCTGDTSNNIWVQPGPPGYPGKCKLDLLTYEQVYCVLQRVPCAKADLLKITSDQCLVNLANSTQLVVPEKEDNAIAASRLMRNSLPYYTVFRGNTDGTVY
jgi:hypothetical protein